MKSKRWLSVIAVCACLLSSGLHAAETAMRIVSADAGITALLRAFALEKNLVGIDVTSPQAADKPLPVIGYHRQLAAEGLLALHPTLLIGGEHMGPPSTLAAVEAASVKVVRLPSVQNGEGLLTNIRQLADVLAQPAQAQLVLEQVQKN